MCNHVSTLAVGVTVGAMPLLTTWCAAADIVVPLDQPTIQAAVNGAANDDEIVLAPGTYRGPGNVDVEFRGKRLTVRSSRLTIRFAKCLLTDMTS